MGNNLFEIDGGSLRKYRGNESAVFVPLGVKTVDTKAFEGCDAVKEITLPETASVFNHASLGAMPRLEKVTFLGKEKLTTRTMIFYRSVSPLSIVFAGDSETFLKSVAPYTIVDYEYDPDLGRDTRVSRTYYPLAHSLGDQIVYKVTCLGDGKSFTLKGDGGKPVD